MLKAQTNLKQPWPPLSDNFFFKAGKVLTPGNVWQSGLAVISLSTSHGEKFILKAYLIEEEKNIPNYNSVLFYFRVIFSSKKKYIYYFIKN